MTSEPKLGDNYIQFGDISSTTDRIHCPFKSSFRIQGRPSFRRSFRRLSLPEHPRFFLSMSGSETCRFPSNTLPSRQKLTSISGFCRYLLFKLFLDFVIPIYVLFFRGPRGIGVYQICNCCCINYFYQFFVCLIFGVQYVSKCNRVSSTVAVIF